MIRWIKRQILKSKYARGIRPDPVFGGMSWGDPVSMLGAAQKVREVDGIEYYRKSDEVSHFGWVNVQSIEYGFFQNRLIKIRIRFDSTNDKVREMLWRAYGEPMFFDWEIGDSRIAWRPSLETNETPILTMKSIHFDELYRKWRADKIEESAQALLSA